MIKIYNEISIKTYLITSFVINENRLLIDI